MSKHKERGPGKVVGHQDRQLLGSVATRAYVDHHVQVLQAGVLKHAVVGIVTSPPTSPVAGMYIVGKNPTGAFAGWAGKIVLHVPGFGGAAATWADINPADKEQRLVEDQNAIYQYNAATSEWLEVVANQATGVGPAWFSSQAAYHKQFVLPSGWKQITVECQGRITSQTNTADARLEFQGDAVPALNGIFDYGGFWGHSHNDYQYAEKTWWKANMLDGKSMKMTYPIGGHYFGAVTKYHWKVILTAFPTYVVVHGDINGNRRETNSSYQIHYITQAAFNLAPTAITGIDLGFHGQELDMAGTVEIIS